MRAMDRMLAVEAGESSFVTDKAAGTAPRKRTRAEALECAHAAQAADEGKRSRGGGRLKVDIMLKEEDHDAYLALLRDPKTTNASARQWLGERGYTLGQTAVDRHSKKFRDQLKRMRRAAEMAQAFAALARESGIGVMTDAVMARSEQLLMEQMYRVSDDPDQAFTPKEWSEMNKAIGESIANRRNAEAMRREFEQEKRRIAAETQQAAHAGGDGQAIADRVREILGIPPGEDAEGGE